MFGPVQGMETEGSVTLEVRELDGGVWDLKFGKLMYVRPNVTVKIFKYGGNF
jgi:hypothetical protein